MAHEAVRSEGAPAPIGPYSQGVRAGELLFCSGCLGTDPASGELVADDVGAQTKRALDNLGAILAAGGAGFEHVVKTTIFLRNMSDFTAVNAIYGERFTGIPPARSTVEVARLPKDALVEIEAVARVS